MTTHAVTARVTGVLFIAATSLSVMGTSILNPVLKDSNHLTMAFENENRILLGALLILLGGCACTGIAVALYPVLRKYSEGLALGSVCCRLAEGVSYTVDAAAIIMFAALSREFTNAENPVPSFFEAAWEVVVDFRAQVVFTSVMTFYVGALMYYYIFFRSQIIPRWLSIWGAVGVVLGFIAGLLGYFDVIGSMSTPQIVMNLPIAVNEMVLAVWLIVKGFNVTQDNICS